MHRRLKTKYNKCVLLSTLAREGIKKYVAVSELNLTTVYYDKYVGTCKKTYLT